MRVSALIAAMSLGLTGVSLAGPQDAPGTIYIDGVACNLPCQSYMAWSRQTLKANHAAARGTANVSAATVAREIDRKRISKRMEPASADAPSLKKNRNQAALTAVPEPPLPRPRAEAVPLKVETHEQPAAPATAPEPALLPPSKAESAESHAPPKERSTQELVMAALAVAEQMTSAEPSKATDGDRANEDKAGDANRSSSRNVSGLVAILVARPDVKSAAGLVGQIVAVDAAESGVQQDIDSALAAAGATGVLLSVSDASPIDRLIGSDVQAAIVKLASQEAADAFPDIKGFKVLRVPLTPR